MKNDGPQEVYIPAKHAELYVLKYGAESAHGTILLINGHMRSSSDFRAMAAFLIKAGWDVITFDNRGSGKTRTQDFGLNDLVEDVKAVLDFFEIQSAAILGISMGGMIAQLFSAAYPTYVSVLVLVSTSMVEPQKSKKGEEWSSDVDVVLGKLEPYFSETFIKKNKLLVRAMAKSIATSMGDGAKMQGSRLQRNSMRGIDTFKSISKRSGPTLIMHGDCDLIIPLTEARRVNQAISGSEILIYPDAGHLLIAERSAKFYSDAEAFIKKNLGQKI
jgi:3-oxoadipate enol-lactonase